MKIIDKVIKKFRKDIEGKHILEIACGQASFSIAASKTALHIDCIDIDDKRLDPEARKLHNLKFHVMDARKLEFDDALFDTVILYNTVKHLEYCMAEVINEAARVLKNEGCIYVISSFSMDKPVIQNVLPDIVKKAGLNYEPISFDKFECIKIKKQR